MDRILRVFSGGSRAAVAALALAAALAGALRAGQKDSDEAPRQIACPTASPLPAAVTAGDRSPQLEQVAQQADRRIRHGFELAGRGAHFAARAELVGALRLVAEGLDTEQNTNVHSRALAAALVALKEAENFLPDGSRLEADLDVPGIVAAHTTPVLKNVTEQVSSLTALRCYLTFAQEQFAAAAGDEIAGSMALHALGKLHTAVAQKKGALIAGPETKAMVFYQAAMLVYPQNYMAANDLGVLLARCGNYGDAQAMFQRSVTICPQAANWQNLAKVYMQLGQAALAQQAAQRATLLARRQTAPASGNGLVQWLDSPSFAQTSANAPNANGFTPVLPRTSVAGRPDAALTAGRQSAADRRAAPSAAERMSWGTGPYQR
jgi:tetratricopeptide (TPR) repeat protein